MGRPKEPTLFKARILATDYFGNDAGDIVNIKYVDSKNNVYYYDGFHRWTILEKSEEGIAWEKVQSKKIWKRQIIGRM